MPIIFLSPSLQPFNEYEGGGNEQQYMNEVADAMEPLLLGNAIRYTRSSPRDTLAGVIRQSNEGEYDLHLALHSNAAGASMSGQLNGSDFYYYRYSEWGKRAAENAGRNVSGDCAVPRAGACHRPPCGGDEDECPRRAGGDGIP